MLLDVNMITAGYGSLMVLRDISFSMPKGETLAIIGPNGAGKTTLLWTLSGMINPKSGSVKFDDTDITGWDCSKVVKLGLGHVLEGMHVFSTLNVEDNLMLGAYRRKIDAKKNLQKVFKYFPVLEKKRSQAAGSLSGGEKQMLAIGRTLMCELKLLLLDEPSAGLAPMLVKRLFEILKELRQEYELTILIVEQNAEIALDFADRGMVLAQGRVVLERSATDLINDPEVKKIYLGEGCAS